MEEYTSHVFREEIWARDTNLGSISISMIFKINKITKVVSIDNKREEVDPWDIVSAICSIADFYLSPCRCDR